jgi:hypothetical protein
VREKVAQLVFLPKLMQNLYRGKNSPKNVFYFCNFQTFAQSKLSPNGRKIAESGHPAYDL